MSLAYCMLRFLLDTLRNRHGYVQFKNEKLISCTKADKLKCLTGKLKVFRYSFWETIPMFFNRPKHFDIDKIRILRDLDLLLNFGHQELKCDV